jgi:serine/threonine-protein kinase
MAEVYAAQDLHLNHGVAIKLAAPFRSCGARPEALLREARLLSCFSHPNIVSVYDWGKSPAGRAYYSMELVPGVTLRELVIGRGPLTLSRVADLVLSLCDALGAVHDLGVVHHDVTPSNVLVSEAGGDDVRVRAPLKLIDFGIAQRQKRAGDLSAPIIGTPGYIAPEVRHGEPSDHRADFYSVGMLARYLLTGRSLGGTTTTETVPGDEPWEVDGTPVPAVSWIQRCISERPQDRPASASALADLVVAEMGDAPESSIQRRVAPRTMRPPSISV